MTARKAYREVSVELVDEPSKVARSSWSDEKLDELVGSIRLLGLLNPITLRPKDDGRFEVIAGHRRLMAVKRLNWAVVAAHVFTSDDLVHAARIHENIEREELSPADEALYFGDLYAAIDDTDKVAELVKKSREYVEGRLSLITQGYKPVFDALRDGKISLGVAQELNRFEREADAEYHMDHAIRDGCSIRQMRDWRSQTNERRRREELAAATTQQATEGTEASGAPAPPEVTPVPLAAPWQRTGEIQPRPCLYCGEKHEEYRMLRYYVCAPCVTRQNLPQYGKGEGLGN